MTGLDVRLQSQFPQLAELVRTKPLTYLDSAATTLKPRVVIDRVNRHLALQASNVHRGSHWLGDQATEAFEQARVRAGKFIGAESDSEIVFTSGTTDGLNLLAYTLSRVALSAGDEIILTQMEHHSNIVPWQLAARERGFKINFVRVDESGQLDLNHFEQLLSPKVKVVSVVHQSNVLGTVNPVSKIFASAREQGAVCVLDAAQSVAARSLDVTALGCDFLVFSGHKIFAPTGVGVLYGRSEWLKKLPPYRGGGSMVDQVTEAGTTFLEPPHRFEAGTPPIAEVIGLGAALEFVEELGFETIERHERELVTYAHQQLSQLTGLRFIGRGWENGSNVISFVLEGVHHSDVASLLDQQGVAVRAGHHCCQPLMHCFGIPGTVRASFSVYNSSLDVDRLVSALKKAQEMLL